MLLIVGTVSLPSENLEHARPAMRAMVEPRAPKPAVWPTTTPMMCWCPD